MLRQSVVKYRSLGGSHGAKRAEERRSDPQCQQHQSRGSLSPGGCQHPEELRGNGQHANTFLNCLPSSRFRELLNYWCLN